MRAARPLCRGPFFGGDGLASRANISSACTPPFPSASSFSFSFSCFSSSSPSAWLNPSASGSGLRLGALLPAAASGFPRGLGGRLSARVPPVCGRPCLRRSFSVSPVSAPSSPAPSSSHGATAHAPGADSGHHGAHSHAVEAATYEDGSVQWGRTSQEFHWDASWEGQPPSNFVSVDGQKMILGSEAKPFEQLFQVAQANLPFWPRTRLAFLGNHDVVLKSEFLFFYIPTFIIFSMASELPATVEPLQYQNDPD
eukprot:GHVT01001063.1.p3 GENE.GHVT01001063.1~~GHVT01001063.1.p3  ORF type:complete len:254 (-),score=68.15 GHVT01001063.1:1384-2145(-)